MIVSVHLKGQSKPIVREDVRNAYEKGSFYVVEHAIGGPYEKWPIVDVFSVVES